jgi:hypothetical protein
MLGEADRIAWLREMLREAERVIDHEVRAIEELDKKTAQALTLSLSGLSLFVLLGGFVGPKASPAFLALFMVAGVLNAGAVYLLVKSYHGPESRAEVNVGPSPVWMAEKLGTQEGLGDHYAAVLFGYAEYHIHNVRFMDEIKKARSNAVGLLSLAGAFYAAAATVQAVKLIGG